MNIIAFYLPQYHSIPENEEWWGKNYTEWDSLKRGTILIDGQYQPRIPINKDYYNLLDVNVMRKQAELAKNKGIYGFCVYHYWFNGKKLLEKPMEQLLENPDIEFPFCFCWANEDWSNIWEGDTERIKILISNKYNDKNDWIEHFNYFLPFFKDPRYIKQDNKPLLVIYNPLLIREMEEIKKCWNQMAINAGFDGIVFLYQSGRMLLSNDKRKTCFDYGIEYYPGLEAIAKMGKRKRNVSYLLHNVATFIRQKLGLELSRRLKDNVSLDQKVKEIEYYDDVWNFIINRKPEEGTTIPGAFVDWDNTPRRKYAGKVILGATPQKFKTFFTRQVERARNVYKRNAIFIFAWNEWSEGGYLEPDEKYGYAYLDAIHEALEALDELPNENVPFSV